MTIKRIGFPCKWIDHPTQVKGIKSKDPCRELNTSVTTMAWLNRQTRQAAEQRLWDIMVHNINSITLLITRVSQLPESRKMVRLGSDILPGYTEPTWGYFWQKPDVRAYCEKNFITVGDLARKTDVRLSFHPGPFVVLASDNPEIVERSRAEFEYHVDMARWMGYGRTFQDYKINVHIAGRLGPAGIMAVWKKLSPEARNCLTIENDEMTWGLDSSLELATHCALVLDLHHHFIKTGEYIEKSDDRVKNIIDSWRGVRPVIHYSVSRPEHIPNPCPASRPCLNTLLAQGVKKTQLRAHSDFMWNTACNEWALSHLEYADIMVESKSKNLGSAQLYDQLKSYDQNMAH